MKTNQFKLKSKGRKASLNLATFHAESSDLKAMSKGMARKLKARKEARCKRSKRLNTRDYIALGEYVQPIKVENVYSVFCDFHIGFTLIYNKERQAFERIGGHQFRLNGSRAALPIEDAKKDARTAFLNWCKGKGYKQKFAFSYVTNRREKTVTMLIEPVL